MPKMYGQGAIQLSDDQRTYRAVNGCIEVPEKFISHLITLGWSRDDRRPKEVPTPDSPLSAVVELPVDGIEQNLLHGEPESGAEPERIEPPVDAEEPAS